MEPILLEFVIFNNISAKRRCMQLCDPDAPLFTDFKTVWTHSNVCFAGHTYLFISIITLLLMLLLLLLLLPQQLVWLVLLLKKITHLNLCTIFRTVNIAIMVQWNRCIFVLWLFIPHGIHCLTTPPGKCLCFLALLSIHLLLIRLFCR